MKTYKKPEFKVINFGVTEDIIQTSGELMEGMPKYIVGDTEATAYSANTFSIFNEQ